MNDMEGSHNDVRTRLAEAECDAFTIASTVGSLRCARDYALREVR